VAEAKATNPSKLRIPHDLVNRNPSRKIPVPNSHNGRTQANHRAQKQIQPPSARGV
jgi:hypothetical protein